MAPEQKRGRKRSAKKTGKRPAAGSTPEKAPTSSAGTAKRKASRKSAGSSSGTARSKKTSATGKPRSAGRKKLPANKPPGSLVSIHGTVSSETRREMIAVAAFLRAEQRQFQDGDPVEDWLIAEKEVDRFLGRNS